MPIFKQDRDEDKKKKKKQGGFFSDAQPQPKPDIAEPYPEIAGPFGDVPGNPGYMQDQPLIRAPEPFRPAPGQPTPRDLENSIFLSKLARGLDRIPPPIAMDQADPAQLAEEELRRKRMLDPEYQRRLSEAEGILRRRYDLERGAQRGVPPAKPPFPEIGSAAVPETPGQLDVQYKQAEALKAAQGREQAARLRFEAEPTAINKLAMEQARDQAAQLQPAAQAPAAVQPPAPQAQTGAKVNDLLFPAHMLQSDPSLRYFQQAVDLKRSIEGMPKGAQGQVVQQFNDVSEMRRNIGSLNEIVKGLSSVTGQDEAQTENGLRQARMEIVQLLGADRSISLDEVKPLLEKMGEDEAATYWEEAVAKKAFQEREADRPSVLDPLNIAVFVLSSIMGRPDLGAQSIFQTMQYRLAPLRESQARLEQIRERGAQSRSLFRREALSGRAQTAKAERDLQNKVQEIEKRASLDERLEGMKELADMLKRADAGVERWEEAETVLRRDFMKAIPLDRIERESQKAKFDQALLAIQAGKKQAMEKRAALGQQVREMGR